MIWIIACVFALFFFAISNLFDTYFANHMFKSTHAIVFYLSLLNVIFLPLVILYEVPTLPPISMIPYLLLLGFTNVIYLYPWYKALREGEVSSVVSLWALGKIFIPILAFLIVNETLSLNQYFGFFIIIFASALLSYEGRFGKRFTFNSSLWWMILCSFIVAVEVVLYRYVFMSLSWSSGFVWSFVASLIFVLPLLCVPSIKVVIKDNWFIFKSNIWIILAEEFATFLAMASVTIAISLQKVSIVETIMSLEPIVIMGVGYIWARFFTSIKKYHLTKNQILFRVGIFLMMGFGIYLTFR